MKYNMFYEPIRKRYTKRQVEMALETIEKYTFFVCVTGTNKEKISSICKIATTLNNPLIRFLPECGIENIVIRRSETM